MTEYTFKGRIREKEAQASMLQLVELQHTRKSFVYKRLSSHEQVKKSIFSIAMQDALEELAIADGYKPKITKEQIQAIRSAPDYPGYYINGDIIVEERDLGVSGTLGREDRKGLAYLITKIEADEIESIYIVHISRLFRDQTLIDGLSFGEMCKKHNVVLVMPNMRLNLRDKMHMRIFRMELERSADELEVMNLRMGGARKLKAKQGYYASGAVPVGYILDRDRSSPHYDKYIVYEPHAKIIKQIFQLFPELNYSYLRVALNFRRNGINIPCFPPELNYMETRSAANLMKRTEDGKGYLITWKFIARAISNPVYIGWWIWGGELVSKNNHHPILDENLFWAIQNRIKESSKGRTVYSEPFMLEGLVYCAKHKVPTKLFTDYQDYRYRCSGDYRRTMEHSYCFGIAAKLIDEPLGKFIISQCSYSRYTEKIIKQIRSGYDEAKEKADSSKREYKRLTAEIENLKENLAYTKNAKQVEMLLEMIDEKLKDRERLSRVEAYPAGRVGKAINIDRITNFLTHIDTIWDKQPIRFKNEFLHIIIDKIIIDVGNTEIKARIIWKAGWEQEILIRRPLTSGMSFNKWTDQEKELLYQRFANAKWSELFQLLPNRGYLAILSQANKMGLRRKERSCKRGKVWTEAEDEILKDLCDGVLSFKDAMSKLERTASAMFVRMHDLGISASKFKKENASAEWKVINPGIVNGNHGQGTRTPL